jgi:hypothetical protein
LLEQFQEKCEAVFRPELRQSKEQSGSVWNGERSGAELALRKLVERVASSGSFRRDLPAS